jgi:hypothetical protein
MSTTFKTLLSLVTFGAFFVSAAALADYRDYNDKAWNSIYKREHSVATARSNRLAAPAVVRTSPAPVEVAQAPTQERAYSYEPAKDAGSAPAAKTAPKAASSNRSFSYDPATSAPSVRHSSGLRDASSYERAMRAKGY